MARSLPALFQRFLRAAAFLFGLALGTGVSVFAYSNRAAVDISWWRFHAGQVPLAYVVLVPLALGILAGYVYHLPARLHHFTEHMRHRSRVRELEHENHELKRTVEALLEMPDDSRAAALPAQSTGRRALPALHPGPEPEAAPHDHAPTDHDSEPEEAPAAIRARSHRPSTHSASGAGDAHETAASANGHRARARIRRPPVPGELRVDGLEPLPVEYSELSDAAEPTAAPPRRAPRRRSRPEREAGTQAG